MRLATCPPPSDLERLFLGGLTEPEAQSLEQHLLECGPCLEKLKQVFRSKDTLAGLLSADTKSDILSVKPGVATLIDRLKALRPGIACSSAQGAAMVAFTCSACSKKLSIADKFTGKKIKCPSCGKVTAVPAEAAVASGDPDRTLPPITDAASSPSEVTNLPTVAPVGGNDATQGVEAGLRKPDASLTDFLAPPQVAGELGRLGKYRILKVLGHGGMGVVYLAEDPRLKRSVALKAMLPALAASASCGKRFLLEAQAMAAVEHDHIVRIYQVDEERGVPFMAMEFLKGEPLDERLSRQEKLPLTEVLRIGREIALALEAAHAKGLIHRDIKPANIWLEAPRGRVKILDFGLARAASQETGLTQQGAIIGTPSFMAPEQGRGDAVDGRCDLFSLGVVLYRLCSGRLPFQGKDTVSMLVEVALTQPEPPAQLNAGVPPELSAVVMQLLEKNPDKRPASAGSVVQVLDAVEKLLARPEEAVDKTQALMAARSWTATAGKAPPRRRWIALAAAAAAAALLLAAAGTVFFWQTPHGIVRIQIDDPDVKVAIDKDGFKIQGADKHDISLAPGEHGLRVKRGDLEFDTDKFSLRKGTMVTLKVELLQGKVQVVLNDRVIGAKELPGASGGVDDARPKVGGQLAEKQVAAVIAKLKELNPGFDGKETHKIEGGVVTELAFVTDKVTDISPVQVLAGLKSLDCGSTTKGRGKFANLSPLKGMKLTSLRCWHSAVSDLSPLQGMPLVGLGMRDCKVRDLAPLQGMPLTSLVLTGGDVADLSPLQGMPLTRLTVSGRFADLSPLKGMRLTKCECSGSRLTDLSPLKGMPLTQFGCALSPVADLTPLQGMQLTQLSILATKVSDLTPLKGMPLTGLDCRNTQVADLSPLQGMPLKELSCDIKPERDAEVLRSIKTLETINEKPAKKLLRQARPR